MVSSIRTVPAPSTIGFSSVNTRPIKASVRLLRNGLLSLTDVALCAKYRQAGTLAAANSANIRSCVCQDGLITNDSNPTSSADSPSQNRNMPGAASSSAIRMKPKISQFQVPNVVNISAMTQPSVSSNRTRQHNGGEPPLPLWERVGVRGYGLSIVRDPSPGSHLAMRHSRSFASAFFSRTAANGGLCLSHNGGGGPSVAP